MKKTKAGLEELAGSWKIRGTEAAALKTRLRNNRKHYRKMPGLALL